MEKLIYTSFTALLFIGCATNQVKLQNSTLETPTVSVEEKSANEAIVTQRKKRAKVVKKVSKRVKKEPSHPMEVARVCFDKKGTAHNCNYKIKKPYFGGAELDTSTLQLQ